MMEASVVFGRLALTNSIPAPSASARRHRPDGNNRDVRIVLLACPGKLRRPWPDPAALREFWELAAIDRKRRC
jgi:hypothetical protein